MRLTLLAIFWTLATRNERSAMVRIVCTRAGRRLLVRCRGHQFLFGAPPVLPIWFPFVASLSRPIRF